MLALVRHLQEQDLVIRYDRVALDIGDSLIRAISQEVTDGDFLIAVISPDSLQSEWCQHELSLAKTQAINERRVKVLPVKFRNATMPPMLQDTFWGDADRDDVETVARRLVRAMRANLEGREAEARREAEAAENAGGEPAHAEVAGDVTVTQIDAVAARVFDVLSEWDDLFRGHANLKDIVDQQRRLRWELNVLPQRVRVGLPLVAQLAEAEDDFFAGGESDEVEPDLRDEMHSVRTQVAQGLPVTQRWTVDEPYGRVDPGNRDAISYLWQIRRGNDTRRIQVFISGTASASANDGLPREVVEAKETEGRSVVKTLLAIEDPPRQVMVTTAGISLTLPD